MKPRTAVKLSASAQYLIKNVRFWHKADMLNALDCPLGGAKRTLTNRSLPIDL